jgi:replication initiation and membrane attachment protein
METFNYIVTVKRNINIDDRKTIMNLYQPILGSDATSIYFTLLEEKDVLTKLTSLVFNEKRLMTLLKLTNPKLMEGIHKLEGLKLLKRSYLKSKNLVTFQIQAPVFANDFFENIILNDMLKKALGDQDYEVIRYCYLDDDILDDATTEDITVSFVEAFPEETNEISLQDLNFASQRSLNDELIDFQNLELELIKNDLPAGILTKAAKKILLENISFFDLDQEVILNALLSAYDYENRQLQKKNRNDEN